MDRIAIAAVLLSGPKLSAKEIGRFFAIILRLSIVVFSSVFSVVTPNRLLDTSSVVVEGKLVRITYFNPKHVVGRKVEVSNSVLLAFFRQGVILFAVENIMDGICG
jgi:hypothetical protein